MQMQMVNAKFEIERETNKNMFNNIHNVSESSFENAAHTSAFGLDPVLGS